MSRYFRFPIFDFRFKLQIANLKLANTLMLVISIWTMSLVSTASASLRAADEEIESQKAGGSEGRLSDFPVFSDVDVPPAGEDSHIFYLLLGEKKFRSREFAGARMAFQKVLELDSQDAQAHYFLGLIEYEEGNIEKAKTRFRIAHECLGRFTPQLQVGSGRMPVLPDAKQVQLEFPYGYEARVYYKDGWYVRPKEKAMSQINGTSTQTLVMLEADSAYRIELKPGRKESWARRGVIGLIVAISFLLAR